MATFTKKFRSLVQEFLLVLISNQNIWAWWYTSQNRRLKFGVLLKTFFKCHMYLESIPSLEYRLCLNDDLFVIKTIRPFLLCKPKSWFQCNLFTMSHDDFWYIIYYLFILLFIQTYLITNIQIYELMNKCIMLKILWSLWILVIIPMCIIYIYIYIYIYTYIYIYIYIYLYIYIHMYIYIENILRTENVISSYIIVTNKKLNQLSK